MNTSALLRRFPFLPSAALDHLAAPLQYTPISELLQCTLAGHSYGALEEARLHQRRRHLHRQQVGQRGSRAARVPEPRPLQHQRFPSPLHEVVSGVVRRIEWERTTAVYHLFNVVAQRQSLQHRLLRSLSLPVTYAGLVRPDMLIKGAQRDVLELVGRTLIVDHLIEDLRTDPQAPEDKADYIYRTLRTMDDSLFAENQR